MDMGQLRNAMDTLLSHCVDTQSIDSSKPAINKNEEFVEPENLSDMDLLYAVYAAAGISLVGNSSAGFAYFSQNKNRLVVVNSSCTQVRNENLDTLMGNAAMDIAQRFGAGFLVYGDQVICNLHGVSQAGGTYAEAAMRAMLALFRQDSRCSQQYQMILCSRD